VTLRDAAKRWEVSAAIPQIVGTPEQVANENEHIWRETGCYGFNLSSTTMPDSAEVFVDHVVPLLQQRGVYRKAYAGDSFRAHLLS
jgi:long-chain alkane monooxygenase